jgi:hypothetical protein
MLVGVLMAAVVAVLMAMLATVLVAVGVEVGTVHLSCCCTRKARCGIRILANSTLASHTTRRSSAHALPWRRTEGIKCSSLHQ